MTPRTSRMLQWIIIAAMVIAIPWAILHYSLRQHRLSFVPPAMGVSKILYAAEDSWGFGPGGNEIGIIVYEMPEPVAAALAADGTNYLARLPVIPVSTRHGEYSDWRRTPTTSDPRWPKPGNKEGREWTSPGIGDFMFGGFFIQIDAAIEKMVNEAIVKPGSFYAYGRIGLIILIPAERRIVVAYSG